LALIEPSSDKSLWSLTTSKSETISQRVRRSNNAYVVEELTRYDSSQGKFKLLHGKRSHSKMYWIRENELWYTEHKALKLE